MITVPIAKRMEIITNIQDCFILWINVNYKEMVETKCFLANPNHQYHVSQYGELYCSANNKKNRDYYEYPSLPHFIDEL